LNDGRELAEMRRAGEIWMRYWGIFYEEGMIRSREK